MLIVLSKRSKMVIHAASKLKNVDVRSTPTSTSAAADVSTSAAAVTENILLL